MKNKPDKKSTKFKKVVKWMGIAELVLLVAFLVWLLGFRWPLAFYKVEELNPGQYIMKYHGDIYHGKKDFTWRLIDEKNAGFANGFSHTVFKSTGDDKNKFLEVWDSLNVQLRGYGTFTREGIELGQPSTKNVCKILINHKEIDEDIKEEILRAFDAYNSNEITGIPFHEGISECDSSGRILTLDFFHAKYNLSCWIDLYILDGNYYLIDEAGKREFIPIPYEIGEKIEEN